MTKPRGGAARKAPDGLTIPIALRGNQELIDALDRIKDARNEDNPGQPLSRADVIRGMLWYAISLDTTMPSKRGRKGAKS